MRLTVTVKPPRGVRSWENLAGCVGRSRLRNGHESFRVVRNGLESFLFRDQAYNCERAAWDAACKGGGGKGGEADRGGAGWREEGIAVVRCVHVHFLDTSGIGA